MRIGVNPVIFRLGGWLLLVLGLSACSLTGQQVYIDPALAPVSSQALVNNQTLTLQVKDQRPRPEFGFRSQNNPRQSLITPANDPAEAVQRALLPNYASMGFTVQTGGQKPADVVLEVTIKELSYKTDEGHVSQLNLIADLAVEVRKGRRTFKSSFKATQSQRVALAPSEEENAGFINEVLAASLTQMLKDVSLNQFLLQ